VVLTVSTHLLQSKAGGRELEIPKDLQLSPPNRAQVRRGLGRRGRSGFAGVGVFPTCPYRLVFFTKNKKSVIPISQNLLKNHRLVTASRSRKEMTDDRSIHPNPKGLQVPA
jgi:hypothetical protein